MLYAALFLLGFGPSLVWLYWLWSRDQLQREPWGLVFRVMAGGGLLSVALTLLTVPLYERRIPALEESVLVHNLLTAALPEEIFKLLPVLLFAWRSPHWNEYFDGIVYAGASALGFHLTETLLYMFGSLDAGVGEALYQALVRGAKPGHMLYGVAMGYYLSHAKFDRTPGARLRAAALALLVPVALHTAWNASVSAGGNFVGGETVGQLVTSLIAWGLSVGLWVAAFGYVRQNRAVSPWNPAGRRVPAGGLPCGACGSPYPAKASFCPGCGSPLLQTAE